MYMTCMHDVVQFFTVLVCIIQDVGDAIAHLSSTKHNYCSIATVLLHVHVKATSTTEFPSLLFTTHCYFFDLILFLQR